MSKFNALDNFLRVLKSSRYNHRYGQGHWDEEGARGGHVVHEKGCGYVDGEWNGDERGVILERA